MNYYPNNFYQNYQPQSAMNPTSYSQFSPQSQQLLYGLQGKVVESADMVKVTEIPFGSYGVFPKTDLGEIYLKTWNNNGTTKILTYKPVEEAVKSEVDTNAIVLEKINQIETKIDELFSKYTIATDNVSTAPIAESKKKEVKLNNEY